ncbi:MAG: thioesterase family protein [Saprospiraceae bacterium]|jgi:acyl-CoA thioester hydrolase
MFTHQFQFRVRYAETDQMGYVYYGNYMQYYEIGRVEALRSLGILYADLESLHGIFMPVVSVSIRYLRPAYYDNLLTIETSIQKLPENSIHFDTNIFNEEKERINSAQIILCFLNSESKVRISTPQFILDKLYPYFEKK